MCIIPLSCLHKTLNEQDNLGCRPLLSPSSKHSQTRNHNQLKMNNDNIVNKLLSCKDTYRNETIN